MQLSDTITLDGILQDLYFEGKFNNSTFDPNDVLRIVNKYYFQMVEAIKGVNEDFYYIMATTDLVIGDGSYTFPDGNTAPPYTKVKQILGAFTPADITNPLVNEYEVCNIINPTQLTNPAYEFSIPTAIIYGNYFVLHPLVTDVTHYPVTRGVKMGYIQEVPPLVNPTDVPLIFKAFHDIITWGSLTEIAPRLGNKTIEAKAIKAFAVRMKELQDFASNHVPNMEVIIEGQDNQGGWAYPWGNQSMS